MRTTNAEKAGTTSRLLSADDDDDEEVLEDGTPRPNRFGNLAKNNRKRSRSKSITPPPPVSEDQLQLARRLAM